MKSDKMMDLQLRMRELSFKMDQVEFDSEKYWELFDEHEKVQEEYYKVWGASEEDIKDEDEQTELNRDN